MGYLTLLYYPFSVPNPSPAVSHHAAQDRLRHMNGEHLAVGSVEYHGLFDRVDAADGLRIDQQTAPHLGESAIGMVGGKYLFAHFGQATGQEQLRAIEEKHSRVVAFSFEVGYL